MTAINPCEGLITDANMVNPKEELYYLSDELASSEPNPARRKEVASDIKELLDSYFRHLNVNFQSNGHVRDFDDRPDVFDTFTTALGEGMAELLPPIDK